MKNIVTGTDIKKIDDYTIRHIGIPSMVLMERAALSAANLIRENESKKEKVLIVAGVGNNGADGLAIGRILHLWGYHTSIYIAGDIEKASDAFGQQLRIVTNLGIEMIQEYKNQKIVVDALFGVGLSREITGSYEEIIREMNAGKNTIYAVDIPSGVNADDAKVCGVAVRADYTVTFGCHKIGTVLYPGADYCGSTVVADIGYFQETVEQHADAIKYATKEDLNRIPVRPNYSNKGTFGKILLIAGSKEISGAAVLSALAAFRVGAGLVRIFTHENNRETIARLLPEAMINTYHPDRFDKKSLEACLHWCDVVAIGPGIGTGTIQQFMVEQVINSKIPAVIDADGLNNISKDRRLLKKLHKNIIITPHLGEMSRLMNVSAKEIAENLIQYARAISYQYHVNCILKDARTVIATERETYINLTGNSGMATAGSGDVLTGIVAGFIGIGVAFDKVAVLAPYIHGMAGDMAAKKVSKQSMMATDIIEELKSFFH